VDTLAAGGYGKMVCLHATHIEAVAIEDAVSQLKKVPPDGEVVKAAQSIGVSFGK
jgi:6-phosphofructokinase 1